VSCCPPAGLYNIVADQGATLSRTITWKDSARTPINVTGYTARMHVRATVTANTTVLVLTTENSRISLGGASGTVTMTVSATDMANVASGQYVYDLELVAPVTNVVSRLIQGNFLVRAEVTR
jgi:hypothetical protein